VRLAEDRKYSNGGSGDHRNGTTECAASYALRERPPAVGGTATAENWFSRSVVSRAPTVNLEQNPRAQTSGAVSGRTFLPYRKKRRGWRRRLARNALLRADRWLTVSEHGLVEAASDAKRRSEPTSGLCTTQTEFGGGGGNRTLLRTKH